MLPKLGGNPREAQALVLRRVGSGQSPFGRARAAGSLVVHGREIVEEMDTGHCEVAQRLAARLTFPQRVQDALRQVFERWDGKGSPKGLKGEATALPVRIAQVAHDAELAHRVGGVEGAVAVIGERTGGGCDPEIAARFRERAANLLVPPNRGTVWDDVLAAETGSRPYLSGAGLNARRASPRVADRAHPGIGTHPGRGRCLSRGDRAQTAPARPWAGAGDRGVAARGQVRKLDGEAVSAVLDAAGGADGGGTGKAIRVDAISVHRIEGGKSAEYRCVWDTLGLLQQIGAVPKPG